MEVEEALDLIVQAPLDFRNKNVQDLAGEIWEHGETVRSSQLLLNNQSLRSGLLGGFRG